MLASTSSGSFSLFDCISDGRSWRLCTLPRASFGFALDLKTGAGVLGCGVPNKTCLNALTANTGAGVIGSKVDTSRSNQLGVWSVVFIPSASLDSGFLAPDIQDSISAGEDGTSNDRSNKDASVRV